jgi:protein-tyrosine phosphatase
VTVSEGFDAPPTRVLFVCTGNICRSPMAAALLERVAAAQSVALCVASAGLLYEDRPASDGALEWAGRAGYDLAAHRSRVISRSIVADTDLVLAMEPRHVREVVALLDDAWTRTFTLRELAGRSRSVGDRADGETLAGWLDRVGAGRTRRDLLADDPALTVGDPYLEPPHVYDATAAEITAALREVARAALKLRF